MDVIQSTSTWLPHTQLWLYEQVRFLPEHVRGHVMCENAVNLDRFAYPRITALQERGRPVYMFQRAVRKVSRSRQFYEWTRLAKSVMPSLVHSHFGNWGWRDARWTKTMGLAHLVSFYGYDVLSVPKADPVWYDRYREMFESVDGVLCEGPFMAKSIVKLGCPESKMRVHRLGVDLGALPFSPRQWNGNDPLKILMAASFTEKKGLTYGIEAVHRFAMQRDVPVELTIVGDSSNHDAQVREKQKILATIERLQMGPHITLTGSLPRPRIVAEALDNHIFLSPSVTALNGDSEGGVPVTLIEMAATGMPVIATRHCDVPGIVHHNETGLLADERDSEGLCTQLCWLVDHPTEWDRLTSAARLLVERDFNAVNQGIALANIYGDLA